MGLVVGKSVGGSVVRHRVARQLRAQMASRIGSLPAGSGVVIRALPESAGATLCRSSAPTWIRRWLGCYAGQPDERAAAARPRHRCPWRLKLIRGWQVRQLVAGAVLPVHPVLQRVRVQAIERFGLARGG